VAVLAVNQVPIYFVFLLSLCIITTVQAGRVMITLFALKLGADPFTVGILASMASVLPMLLSWQVGRLADRFGARWLLMLGIAGGALGVVAPYFSPSLPALYAAAVTNGLLFACSGASLQNLVGLQGRSRDSSKNFSNYSLVVSLNSFLGPLMAGFSFDYAGPGPGCLVLAALLLVPFSLLLLFGRILPPGSGKAAPAGIGELLSGKGLWRVLANSSLVILGVDLFQIYMPIYGHGIGLSAAVIGVVLAMYSVAAFVVRLILPALIERLSAERLLSYSYCSGALGLLCFPLFESAAMLALLTFLFGLGMGSGLPITMMMTFSSSVKGRTGEAMGLRVTVNQLTRVIVPVVFGFVGSAFGVLPVFWINALLMASGSLFSLPGSRRARKKRPRAQDGFTP
jgi:MFS family permease